MSRLFTPHVSATGVGHPRLSLFASGVETESYARKRALKGQIYISEHPDDAIENCVRGIHCDSLRRTTWAAGIHKRFGHTEPLFVESFQDTYAVAISASLEHSFKNADADANLTFETVTGAGSLFTLEGGGPFFMLTMDATATRINSVSEIQVHILSVREDNKTAWLQIKKIKEI